MKRHTYLDYPFSKLYTFLAFTFVVVFVLYHPVVSTSFSQDDFFHFKVSQTDGSDALQLLYEDDTLQVYYEDLKMPSSLENNVYSVVARIY